jgi:hypothetical protein
MSDPEENRLGAVWRMIQRGLPAEPHSIADRKPIRRPADFMKPDRFIIRELMRKVASPLKKD